MRDYNIVRLAGVAAGGSGLGRGCGLATRAGFGLRNSFRRAWEKVRDYNIVRLAGVAAKKCGITTLWLRAWPGERAGTPRRFRA